MLTAEKLFARTITTAEGCMEWQGAITSTTGYGKVKLGDRRIDTHRASWILTNGEIPDGLFICHKCDNRPCINPAHLFLGTRSDNMRDAYDKGRLNMKALVDAHPVKLTDDDVREIDRRLQDGEDSFVIAADFGVARQTVSKIKLRQRDRYARILKAVA